MGENLWKKIIINGEVSRYSVSDSNMGVRNDDTGRILKTSVTRKGYLMVKLYHNGEKRSRPVHRLVMETYKPYPPFDYDQVNHKTPPDKNGIKWDNDIDSLEWIDGSGNVQHAFDTGLRVPKYGKDHPNVKHDEGLIHDICRMIEYGCKTGEIKRELGITCPYLVRNIRKKKYWKHISSHYNF